jgi:protein-disulfide isomerase
MCAADQNRFWDYHDILFANWDGENQGAFTDKRLVAFAEAIGLDMNAFSDCFNANQFQTEIEADLTAGRDTGISGTPSVLVNGRIISPGFVPSYEDISQAIEAASASPGN